MHKRGCNAFSIMELMVCVGILATAILLMLGIFFTIVAGSQKAVDKTAGFTIGESLLAQQTYQLVSPPDPSFFSTVYAPGTVIDAGDYTVNNASYFYKIYCQDEVLSGLNLYSSIYSPGPINPKRLDMVIWWWDSQSSSATSANNLTMSQTGRAGYGLLQVHLSQLLWPTGPF